MIRLLNCPFFLSFFLSLYLPTILSTFASCMLVFDFRSLISGVFKHVQVCLFKIQGIQTVYHKKNKDPFVVPVTSD